MNIQFRYELTSTMVDNLSNIFGTCPSTLVCYLDSNLARILNMTSLYIVAKFRADSKATYAVPEPPMYGIVARNDVEAVRKYNKLTNSDSGSVIGELVRDCSRMEVIPM